LTEITLPLHSSGVKGGTGIDDTEAAEALNSTVSDLLLGVVRQLPVDELLDLLDQLPGF
jgi:hypothetical protein